MKKSAALQGKILLLSIKKTLFLFFLLNLCLCFSSFAQGGNLKAGQWASVGGELLLSGTHKFTTSWASNAGQQWWQGGFWDPVETRNYSPWENTVLNSVSPKKGQFTVMGPCNIGLYQRAKGPRIHLKDAETEQGFTPWANTIAFSSQVWSGTVKDFNKNEEFWGFIPAGKEVTLNVIAVMTAYDNRRGTGEISYQAPQDIEYEIWFFPRGEEAKILGILSGFDKPQPGILYYTEKKCN